MVCEQRDRASEEANRDSDDPELVRHEFLHASGVYRFFDGRGGLLYVGKAANLRRRLFTHAAANAASDDQPSRGADVELRGAGSKVTRALAGLARVEIEESDSELEALLKEGRNGRHRSH